MEECQTEAQHEMDICRGWELSDGGELGIGQEIDNIRHLICQRGPQ